MAQTIKLKRSATSGATPTTSQLELGEVAINTYDGKMYIKKDVGGTESIVEIGGLSSVALGGLSDVTISSVAADQLLQYNGSEWVNVSIAEASAIMKEYQFTATSGQSTFSGSDDNSETLSYTAGAIQVFLNGIFLDSAVDYTATNGTSIVLSETVDANDYLQVVAFKKKIGDGNVSVDTFTGDDSTTAFTLSLDPGDENNTRVFIDGVYQSKSNYSVSGTTLTFSTAPPTGTAVEVEIGNRVVTLDTLSDLDLPDDVKLRLGTDQDLQIYHDGSNGFIKNTTGDLYIEDSNGSIRIRPKTGESGINVLADSSVELYYDNSKKLETSNDGVTVTGDVEADEFIGDVRGAVLFKAQAGETLAKGEVVYISGISGNTTIVSKADADDASKMPAFGLVAAAASSGNPVDIYTNGILSDIDTSSYSEGDELFVSTTAGALTATAPTGESAALQKIGKVTRSNATSGSIFIVGAGRSNAVPNLDDGDIFIGNASNQAVTASLNTKIEDYLDGGTSTPSLASLAVDSITIDGTEIDSSSSLMLDIAGNLTVNVDGTTVTLADDTINFGQFYNNASGQFNIYAPTQDKDIVFLGNDGGSTVTALTLDMSAAGAATFNAGSTFSGNLAITAGSGQRYIEIASGTSNAKTYRIYNGISWNPDALLIYNHTDDNTVLTIEPGKLGVNRGANSLSHTLDVGGNIAISGTEIVTTSRTITNIGSLTVTGTNANLTLGTSGNNITFGRNGDNYIDAQAGTSSNIVINPENRFVVNTADTERMRIDSSGRVGIGTTSPSSKFVVSDAGGAGLEFIPQTSNDRTTLLSYDRNASTYQTVDFDGSDIHFNIAGNEKARIDSSGRLLVGSTTSQESSSERFLVYSTGSQHSRFMNSSDTFSTVYIKNSSTTANTNQPFLTFQDTGGNRGNFGLRYSTAQLVIQGHGGVGIAGGSGGLQQDPDLFVNTSGNVGIGTTSPSATLDVENSSGAMMMVDDTNGRFIKIRSANSGSQSANISSYASLFLGGQDNANHMVIASSGDVGIGTSSPDEFSVGGAYKYLAVGGDKAGIINLVDSGTAGSYLQFGTAAGIRRASIHTESSADIVFTLNTSNSGTSLTERFRIKSSNGNVGIGNSNPTSRLHISGGNLLLDNALEVRTKDTGGNVRTVLRANSSNELEYGWSANAPVKFMGGGSYTERMRIHTNGYVGIGTASPTSKLTVNTGASGNTATFSSGTSTSGDYSGITLHAYSINGVEWYGSEIRSTLTASNPSYNNPRLGFFTQDHDTYLPADRTEKMSILSNGNVGIGTTSPAAPLHVKHASGEAKVIIQAGSNTSSAVLQFGDSLDSSRGGIEYTSTDDMAFSTNNMTEAMRIRYTGNVGIGESNPDEKLHVSGGGIKVDGEPTIATNSGAGLFFGYGSNVAKITALDQGVAWKNLRLNAAEHEFYIAGGLQAKLDGSGNLLLGAATTNDQSSSMGGQTPDLYVPGYTSLGGLRIRGTDTSNTIYKTGGAFGITLGDANVIKLSHSSGTARLSGGNWEVLDGKQLRAYRGGNSAYGALYMDTGENLFIYNSWGAKSIVLDRDGDVGIGTSDPSVKMHIVDSDGEGLRLENTTAAPTNSVSNAPHLEFFGRGWDSNYGSKPIKARIEHTATYGDYGFGATQGALVFSVQGAGGINSAPDTMQEGMRLAAGSDTYNFPRLGIGDTDPDGPLHVTSTGHASIFEGTGGNVSLKLLRSDTSGAVNFGDIQFANSTGIAAKINSRGEGGSASGNLTFQTRNTSGTLEERVRITSGGFLLVGKTDTTFSNAGIELRGGNFGARFTRNFAEPIFVNRTGNNGDIIKFYGDTVELGAIGSEGGDSLYIQASGATGSGLRFHPSRAAIEPVRQGATIDNVVDLGADTRRFKDLYLSGGAYLGGVAAANKLDDYEEGTFNPFQGIGSAYTGEATQDAKYTKIGRFVHVTIRVNWTGTDGSGNQFGLVLPFVVGTATSTNGGATGAVMYSGGQLFSGAPVIAHAAATTQSVALYRGDGGTFSAASRNDVNGTYDFLITLTYYVD